MADDAEEAKAMHALHARRCQGMKQEAQSED